MAWVAYFKLGWQYITTNWPYIAKNTENYFEIFVYSSNQFSIRELDSIFILKSILPQKLYKIRFNLNIKEKTSNP